MDSLNLKLCDIQRRLFELFYDTKYDIEMLVTTFMNSEIAKNLDSKFNKMQWVGEEYLLEEVLEIADMKICKGNIVITKDILYWMGYIYRFWNLYTGEESYKIYKQAPFQTLMTNYLLFHTMDASMAIDDLKEIYNQKKRK